MKTLGVALTVVVFAVACGLSPNELTGTMTGVIVEYVPAEDADGSIIIFHDGETTKIVVSADTTLEFSSTHIQEHRLTGEPVSVAFQETNGVKEATAIADS